jgi:hypothetical protein
VNGHDYPEQFDSEEPNDLAADPDYMKWNEQQEREAMAAMDFDIRYQQHTAQFLDRIFSR